MEKMSKAICENCWMAVADMEKHGWDEHGILPEPEVLERIQRQAKQFYASVERESAIEMVGSIPDNRSGK